MLAHMKQQKDRGVRIGRIFLVFFSRGDEQKCIKKIHRRRADSRAVFRVHELGEKLVALLPGSPGLLSFASGRRGRRVKCFNSKKIKIKKRTVSTC